MALRTPALYMGNPAVQHTAQNDRLMLAGLHRPEPASTASSRPLTATSGVLVGPTGTMGEVTLLSNTQFTVNPARWVIQSSASALGGAYKVSNDAVETLGITAQNASQYRRSYFGVWVIDSFVAGSGDDLPHWGIVDGALAASAGVAALPSAGSLPANFLALGEFLIPPVGQSVTYTPYDIRTGLRGAILPVTATDTRLPAYTGQYRDHPTAGLQRGTAGAWTTETPRGFARAFLYANAASGVFGANTVVTVPVNTAAIDTHSGMGGGGWSVPAGQGGTYLIDGAVTWTGATTNSSMALRLNVNNQVNAEPPGTHGSYLSSIGAANSGELTLGSILLNLVAGDNLALIAQSSAAWQTAYFAPAGHMPYLTIMRVA